MVGVKTKGIGECPWCKHNPHGCDNDSCDFKKLPFEKVDILKCLKKEAKRIGELREKMLASSKGFDIIDGNLPEKDIAELVDLIKAVDIMAKVLVSEFQCTDENLKEELGIDLKKKMSWGQRAKFMAKLALMKKTRGRNV